jgi:hypothetical protein
MENGMHLSVHRDLPVFTATGEGLTATLFGNAIDPLHPELTESDLLHSLVARAAKLDSLIEATVPFVGRWVIIVQQRNATYLFTDPAGLRQVFYCTAGGDWCASQPEVIKAICGLQPNPDTLLPPFLTHPSHVGRESQWIGSKTLYENCLHLVPNHYKHLESLEQVRF